MTKVGGRYDGGNLRFYLGTLWFGDTRRVYEELIDKLVHELWSVLHCPAEINQLLLNSFCLTHVWDGNT